MGTIDWCVGVSGNNVRVCVGACGCAVSSMLVAWQTVCSFTDDSC